QFTGKVLVLDYFNNPILIGGLLTITIFTGLFAGSYPALYLSSFSPSKVLTGIYKNGSQNTLFRKILVVIQFSISIILIICTFTIFNQINFIKNKSLGYERDQVLFLPLRGGVEKNLEMMKSELLQNSNIISVSAGNALPNRIAAMTSGISWDGKDPDDNSMFRFVSVDHEYLKTFQMEILKGRHFSKEFASDTEEAFIINEEAAKVLGITLPEEKTVTFMERESKIIGIVKNFHFRSLHEKIEPLFIGILPEKYSYFYLFIKTNNSDYSALINQLESFWEKHCSQFPFEYHFVNESFENMYQPIDRMNKIFSFFSALAVFISCMGLFGLSAFMVEQRTKEIGIRKTMGASVSGIVLLLSKEFVKWIIWANILAWPIAYFAMNKWLQNFAYKIEIGIWIFIISALLAMMIAVLTISFQSIKAAIANPVESLRYE
ncbi:MAG: hypothetical protein KAR38_11810, partial [Calditrichia bacterium]|nr:hypothetical protein [Calditrichia bacterium]